MDELSLALTASATTPFPVLVGDLLLSGLLGAMVAAVYRVRAGRDGAAVMAPALVLLAMISAMVMMVIGDSLARAFSLVGALAIVRFRTRLRSPVDITFVFFALAAGISAGVGARAVALAGTGLISAVALLLGALQPRSAPLLLRCDVAAHEGVEEKMAAAFAKLLRTQDLEEARSVRFGEAISYRYRVSLAEGVTPSALLEALSALEGVERVLLTASPERLDVAE